MRFRPAMVLDATELGDLLPLVGAEYVRRRRDDRRDRRAACAARRAASRTACRASPMCSGSSGVPQGERHVIERPARYEFFRAAQPYSLRIEVHGGEIYGEESGWLTYKVFETMPGTKGGLWTYRRLIDSAQFGSAFANDLSMFNWPGNDYREAGIIDRPASEVAAALQDAKRVSLGFLHWLQTEAPAEGDRLGAPELKLRPDIMGTCGWSGQISLHPRVAPHQGVAHGGRAGCVGALSAAGRLAAHFDGFGRRWLVSDRHSSRWSGRRRRQLPHAPVPDPARRPDSRPRPQPARGGQEHRHHAHHQRLLSPASRRVEHRRGGRRAGGILPAARSIAGAVHQDADLRRAFSMACSPKAFLSPGPSTHPWATGSLLRASGAQWEQTRARLTLLTHSVAASTRASLAASELGQTRTSVRVRPLDPTKRTS